MGKYNELHDKAVRLCEGGFVWQNRLCIRAKRVPDNVFACNLCEMGSLCDDDMSLLCAECDSYDNHQHLLYLAK